MPRLWFIALPSVALLTGCGTLTQDEGGGCLERATRLFEAGAYAEAEPLYRACARNIWNERHAAGATFNLGLTLRHLGRYDEAIVVFERFAAGENDSLAPGSHIMEPYRNARPRAAWEIAHCLRLKGDYVRALAAYGQVASKTPFQSWCGNESAAHAYFYRIYTAVCLEHLGRWTEAARHYATAANEGGFYSNPLAWRRLVELYEASGQTDELRQILDEIDRRYIAELHTTAAKHTMPVEKLAEFGERPAKAARFLLGLRAAAKDGRRDELVRILQNKQTRFEVPDETDDWQILEAVRLLAATPRESTTALLAAVKHTRPFGDQWLGYALGRCGTEEGVAWLLSRARDESVGRGYNSFIYALSLAGSAGERALDELGHAWALDVRAWVRGDWFAARAKRNALPLAAVSREARLPSDLNALLVR